LYWLGVISMRLKKYDQAEYYTKLMKPIAYSKILLAWIYARQGKYSIALYQAKEAVHFDSTYGEALSEVGHQYENLGQFDKAELYIRKAIEFDNDN